MFDFKTEELLSFSEVVAEITEALSNMHSEDLAKLYNQIANDYTEIEYGEDSLFNKTVYAPIDSSESDIVVGVFYELPDGRITKTHGSNSIKRTILHYFDIGERHAVTLYPDAKNWKKRDDLNDFPNAKNPRLPYVFDLYWDIKYESELHSMFREHSREWLAHEGVIKELILFPELKDKFLNKYKE